MKTFIILLLFVVSAIDVFAQKEDNHSVLTAKEKKELKEDKQYQLSKAMLENRDFVLEADYIQDIRGNRRFVNHTINFVQVDSITAVIQVGSDYRIGPNGVGGVTAKGKITSWKLTENKKSKTFNLYFSVMTPIGIYDLFLMINPFGNSTAELRGMSYGQLTFEGEMVPYSESSIYEGMSI